MSHTLPHVTTACNQWKRRRMTAAGYRSFPRIGPTCSANLETMTGSGHTKLLTDSALDSLCESEMPQSDVADSHANRDRHDSFCC